MTEEGIVQKATKNAREYLLYRIADRRKTANMLWQDEKASKLQYAIADELERVLGEYDKSQQDITCNVHGKNNLQQLDDPDGNPFIVCYDCLGAGSGVFGSIIYWESPSDSYLGMMDVVEKLMGDTKQ